MLLGRACIFKMCRHTLRIMCPVGSISFSMDRLPLPKRIFNCMNKR